MASIADKEYTRKARIEENSICCYGGGGGHYYSYKVANPVTMELKKIIINCALYVDGIQFMFGDGITAQYSGHYGGYGGGTY